MGKRRPNPVTPAGGLAPQGGRPLLDDLRDLIRDARAGVARAVNSTLVLLYWEVGTRIRRDILKNARAEYGEEIVPTLSAQLQPEFGQGFSKRNVFRMVRLAEV